MFLYSLMGFAFLLAIFGIDLADLVIILGVIIPPYFQEKLIKRLGLDKMEVVLDDIKLARKKMIKRSLWQALLVALIFLVTAIYLWTSGMAQDGFYTFDFYFFKTIPLLMLIFFVLAFFTYYLINRRKIRIVED
ncbi:hypothetical protein [Streptococcus merionis]|uniref:hypothetical protein n=1 Tax=Streptococcus merionis TaxID=400065 RepID=UPI003512FD14